MRLRLAFLIAVVFLLSEKTVQAGLGWSISECKKRYGEPIANYAHPLDLLEYVFSAKGFNIHA